MKKIRLRVTLYPEQTNSLRVRNFNGTFEITLDEEDGRAEIRDESEPGCSRDRSAMLGSLIKLEVEAKP